jgi:hypothetical protein
LQQATEEDRASFTASTTLNRNAGGLRESSGGSAAVRNGTGRYGVSDDSKSLVPIDVRGHRNRY